MSGAGPSPMVREQRSAGGASLLGTPPVGSRPRLARRFRRTIPRRWAGVAFVLPAAAYVGLFSLLPVVYGLYLSFTRYSPLRRTGPQFVGLTNYANLVGDPEFHSALWITVRYTVQVLVPLVIIALGLALLANRPFKGVGLFRSALYVPAIVSLTAVSMIWLWLYSQHGLINEILSALGLPSQRWLSEPDSALNAVSLMRVWKALGSNMVLILAGLQVIPKELYEAASVDGANARSQFRHVTLPGLRPVLIFVVTMDIVFLSQSFGELFVMTQGGPLGRTTTVNYLIYKQAFEYNQLGSAAAMAFVLFALIAGFSLISVHALRERTR